MENVKDMGRGSDHVAVSEPIKLSDHGTFQPRWTRVDFLDHDGKVYRASRGISLRVGRRRFMIRRGLSVEQLRARFGDRIVADDSWLGNLLLNEGINEAWSLLCGTGGVKFDATNAYLGVGDSDTAAVATQTGLQAVTNKLYVAMDSGYPTYGASQKATWKSTYSTAQANFAWKEVTVANGTSDASDNMNRKVQDMGTKTSAVARVLTMDITLA